MLTACSSQSPDRGQGDTRSDESSTNSHPIPEEIDDPHAAAIAAYERYWDTLTAAAAAPDGDYTEFEAISADQALEYAISIESDAFESETSTVGSISHNPSIKDSASAEGTTQVVVLDCADSSELETLDQDGNAVAGESYGPQEVQARIELLGGMWIVTVLAIQEVGSCVPDD